MNAFVDVIEDMAASPLVMSGKKIRAILKCLAYYDELKTAVESARQGFDYDDTMKRCYVSVNSAASFRMPSSIKEKVAIFVCLMLEFDQGTRDFYDFILKCFPAESAVDSYIKFCVKVLRPFKEAVLKMAEFGDIEEFKPTLNEVEFASGGLQDQTEYLVLNIVDKVKVANISDAERSDILSMLEGFAAAVDSRDSLMIRSLWIGLKKVLKYSKLCDSEISKLEQALRLYLVVK